MMSIRTISRLSVCATVTVLSLSALLASAGQQKTTTASPPAQDCRVCTINKNNCTQAGRTDCDAQYKQCIDNCFLPTK